MIMLYKQKVIVLPPCSLPLEGRAKYVKLMLNEDSWYRVINAIENPPKPNEKLKQAAKRLSKIKS
ncbi:hypothetical protein BBB57_08260 [Kosakonia sacchari]|nr:hypothetical protein C813_08640 [Kosakonia sacchari SP1]ANR78249.1 hypothetical protein BBB57_08260 [Kosakonia sacchari]